MWIERNLCNDVTLFTQRIAQWNLSVLELDRPVRERASWCVYRNHDLRCLAVCRYKCIGILLQLR